MDHHGLACLAIAPYDSYHNQAFLDFDVDERVIVSSLTSISGYSHLFLGSSKL
jgi:hypothetical protein